MTAKNNILIALLLMLAGITHSGHAQQFKIRATLDTVRETGFYKIAISPELTAATNADLSDIRIATDGNVFVPYINQKEIKRAPVEIEIFQQFPILSNTTDGKFTVVVLENPNPGRLARLDLVVSNNAVERSISLSGSDDKTSWFIIDDSLWFHRSHTSKEYNYVQNLDFPLSSYKYFRLKIDNGITDPLNIVKAGLYNFQNYGPLYQQPENPAPTFTQKDSSNRISYLVIKNTAAYLTDQVDLKISGPRFYNRSGTAYIMHSENDSSSITNPVAHFVLSSDSISNFFTFTGQKAKTIILEIDNKDNPPLKITGVSTRQEIQHLVAWLEKGKIYSLLAGDPNAEAPQYDLSHFKNKIPEDIPTLSYGPLMPVSATVAPAAKPEKNYWLWPTIVGAVIVLSLLTYRLMKDAKQPGG